MVKTNHVGALAAVAAGVFAAVGMLTLTMLLVLVEPAEAAFPGQNGKIAFTSTRAGNPEIYTMNSTGQVLDRLTNDPKGDSQPAWSPGGNKIAFTSNRAGNFDIYVMKANGTGLERITNDPQGDYEPAWSPDGKRIAFTSTRAGNQDIYAMKANGTGLERITNDPQDDYEPAWSPGGGKIAFTSNRVGNFDIYVMKANGTGLERITNDPQGDYEPAWSPDGKRIAFTSTRADNYEIYIMDPSGMSLFRRTNSIQSDFSPDWQPLSPPDNDTTPPKVISTSPKPNATGVAPTVNLKATFSKDMKASSVNAKTFKLFEEDSTTKIAATVNYSAATDKATLNPTEALRKGATYKAVVTSGAKDAAGNPLDQNTAKPGLQQKPWVFTVDERTLPVLLTKPSHEVRDP